MSTATLKKSLGDGGAFICDSHGDDNLLDVLTALSNAGEVLTCKEASPTTGIKASLLTDVASRLGTLVIKAGTCGTANQTDVDVNIDGVQAAQLSIDNADTDGTVVSEEIDVAVPASSLVEIEFTAVATGAANVTATLRLKPVTVEV